MSDSGASPELESRPQSRREWSGWIRSVVLPFGLVVVIVGALLYLESKSESSEDDGFGTVALPEAKNPTSESPSAEVGRAAPDFLLRQMGGGSLRLSDIQGSPVVVNFWASWCTPCRVETPELIDLFEQQRQAGLMVLGINVRESNDAVTGFAKAFGITYPVLMDRSGEVARTWRIGGPSQGIPSTYFIDSEGVVRKVVYGLLTEKLAAEGLAAILPAGGG